MISAPAKITNKLGLHARAAAKLVALAGEYSCRIEFHCKGQEADAKSIMAIMMLAATCGTDAQLICDGNDQEQALSAILELVEDKFGEDE
jgi:phosphocarrier protein HPr